MPTTPPPGDNRLYDLRKSLRLTKLEAAERAQVPYPFYVRIEDPFYDKPEDIPAFMDRMRRSMVTHPPLPKLDRRTLSPGRPADPANVKHPNGTFDGVMIETLRRDRDLTQMQAAMYAKVSVSKWRDWEAGRAKPTEKQLEAWLKATADFLKETTT